MTDSTKSEAALLKKTLFKVMGREIIAASQKRIGELRKAYAEPIAISNVEWLDFELKQLYHDIKTTDPDEERWLSEIDLQRLGL